MQKNDPDFTVDSSVNFTQSHKNSISSTFSTEEFKKNLEGLLNEQITKFIKEQVTQALSTETEKTNTGTISSAQEFKNNLENLLSKQVNQQFEVEFKEEIENLLNNFQDSLAEKITLRTFEKMRREILEDEERIIQSISNRLVNYYRGQLTDSMRHHTTGLSPRMEKNFKQEIEETNVYLGYRPSIETIKTSYSQKNSFSEINKLKNLQTTNKYTQEASLPAIDACNKTAAVLTKQFISQLGVLTFLISIFCAWSLSLASPYLYLQDASIIMVIAVLIISASVSCHSEIIYFNKTGIYRSIDQEHSYFRFIFFAFKIFITNLLLGFVFLIDYNYHAMDFLYHTSSLSFWWIGMTNQLFGFMQLWLSTSTFMAIQYTLLGTSLVLSILSLYKIFIKKD